ncbi:MAG: chemotaxis protein CheB, partial [Mycobacteriales bacterium]
TYPIVMFSTVTERGASATFDALAAGATDYVTKPANVGSVAESLVRVAEQLVPLIKALVPRGAAGPTALRPAAPTPTTRPLVRPPARTGWGTSTTPRPLDPRRGSGPQFTDPHHTDPHLADAHRAAAPPSRLILLASAPSGPPRPVRVVLIGASTGGPVALSRVLGAISTPLPVPVVVVQHMPPVFTQQLAARLDRVGANKVIESAGDEELEPGHVYIAPGDHHLELRGSARGARTALTQGPPVNFCRPSVDVMFRSAVRVFGGDLLAVVLTGMGSDGRAGCEDIVAAGGSVLVQDEASSVVWGMPGVVAMAGLAHRVLPLEQIGGALVSTLRESTLNTTGGKR